MISIEIVSRSQFSDRLGNVSILKFGTEDDPYQNQIFGPEQYTSATNRQGQIHFLHVLKSYKK